METFSEKNVAKSCEREALGGAVGKAGVGKSVGENLLFSRVGEGGGRFKYEVEVEEAFGGDDEFVIFIGCGSKFEEIHKMRECDWI